MPTSGKWQVAGDKNRHSPLATRHSVSCHSQRGVALIITLILLSVVTFMAITFLALSRRERSAVTTVTDTASARLAADAALANAEAQVIANVLATTNPYNFTLLVSTNYISGFGYNTAVGASLTNVNYQDPTGNPLNAADFRQNLINLFYSPRPPVFIPTNSAGANDFRFYLDLNRNARFDANGLVPNVDVAGFTNGTVSEIGDPEWIGVLERPDAPYGPNNKFIARYAFIALPIGNTLDLNYIHNDATRPDSTMTPGHDGFLRNQGVGSWEINLAAFLTDLNINQWDPLANLYTYATWNGTLYNNGAGFEDALSLLKYRYNGTYNNLDWVQNLYSPLGQSAFQNNIDGYSDGPLMTTLSGTNYFQNVVLPWAGADNTNHFFNMQELFNPNEISPTFVNRLLQAGATNSTYDRYTFYRLLSQLGTDSTPDSGKMNLNYRNVDSNGNVVPNMETNFIGWTNALQFFTNAADRLLRAYTTQWRNGNPTNFAITFYAVNDFTFGGTFDKSQWTNYPAFGLGGAPGVIPGIPVLVNNRFVYSPAVNRLLQLAANIYDATTNRYYDISLPRTPLPTVFQPVFTVTNGNVYITNFVEVTNTSFLANTIRNLGFGSTVVARLKPNDLVFGVPLIIGAKKGFPNFNEFALESAFQLTRKLQVTRPNTNSTSDKYSYNQMFLLSVTNQLGVECWNSYSNNYTRPVAISVTDYSFLTLINDENYSTSNNFTVSGSIITSAWQGYNPIADPISAPLSFQIPLNTIITFVPNSMYRYNGGSPFLTTNLDLPYEISGTNYLQPHWGMTITNLLQVVMVDTASGRIIDYVQLSGPNRIRDLSAEIISAYDTDDRIGGNGLWETNLNNGMPAGIGNQIAVSKGTADGSWNQTDQTLVENEIDGFRAFFHLGSIYNNAGSQQAIALANATNNMQAPFTPTATVYQHVTWQANDPLVHYLADDLTGAPNNGLYSTANWPGNLGQLNDRYLPWGGNPIKNSFDFQDAYNTALKDPLVSSSDFWDFPTNKFPTVGWLGRVHRGTPWQTVYLKATNMATNSDDPNFGINAWMAWTGNFNLTNAAYNVPVQDRLLFDLFTTAFNDNATRGTLSVNVGPANANLAAWSALFSGIIVPTNLVGGYTVINPAGPAGAPMPAIPPLSPDSPLCLGYLVQNGTNGINDIRANTNLFPQQTFKHVGDILAVPALTEQSPFLVGLDPNAQISDELMEWLPQQVMSLLRVSGSPRYVIYCYGQTLKPAPNSIYTGSGQFFGMVTNYQVVSEIATRAVVRFGSTVTNVIKTDSVGYWVSMPMVTNNNAVIESFNILPPD